MLMMLMMMYLRFYHCTIVSLYRLKNVSLARITSAVSHSIAATDYHSAKTLLELLLHRSPTKNNSSSSSLILMGPMEKVYHLKTNGNVWSCVDTKVLEENEDFHSKTNRLVYIEFTSTSWTRHSSSYSFTSSDEEMDTDPSSSSTTSYRFVTCHNRYDSILRTKCVL